MNEFKLSILPREKEIHTIIEESGFLSDVVDKSILLKDFTFYEFSLDEINLPSLPSIQSATTGLINEAGLRGWASRGIIHKDYSGVSLTYNPEYNDSSDSIFHQTMGSLNLTQSFSRNDGTGGINLANSYYDSMSFRKIHPVVSNYYGRIFKSIKCAISRSRIGVLDPVHFKPESNAGANWHKDEYPFNLMRINIPVFSSEEHVLQINGEDEYGNSLSLEKHLEPGKAYVWNTRIPHRIFTPKNTGRPRIHIVLGVLPYLNYDESLDTFTVNSHYKVPMHEYVNAKKWTY